MKRAVVVLAAVATIWTLPAHADVKKGEFLVAPQGSFGLPLGDYPSPEVKSIPIEVSIGNYIEPGFGLSARIERMLSDRWAFGGQFVLNVMSVDDATIAKFFDEHLTDTIKFTPDSQWRTVNVGLHARRYFNPESRANPFAHLGLGVYVNKMETDIKREKQTGSYDRLESSETFTNLGLAVGPGVLVRISKDVRLSLEAIVNNVFTEDKSVRYVNLTCGIVFGVTPQ